MAWGKEWSIETIHSYKLTDPVPLEGEKLKAKHPFLSFKEAGIKEKVYNNLTPTHDPYTNPNAHIYYQCNCGAILDPGTKSFAALNNAASGAGWKVRWGATSYIPYCVECGKDVE